VNRRIARKVFTNAARFLSYSQMTRIASRRIINRDHRRMWKLMVCPVRARNFIPFYNSLLKKNVQ
jgi:hypothetical protein